MRIDRNKALTLAAVLVGSLCAGSAAAHVRTPRVPRALLGSQQSLVAPWGDFQKTLQKIWQIEPSHDPQPRPIDAIAEKVDIPLFREGEASAPAWTQASVPRPPLRGL